METPTPQLIEQYQKERVRLLQALRNEPSRYFVQVVDPTPLPEALKKKTSIEFHIKPPTLAVLSQVAEVVETLPAELFSDLSMNATAISHMDAICEMISLVAHGNPRRPVPVWYAPFLKANLTVEETAALWWEVVQKMQVDFFLPFFQTAKRTNPLSNLTRE